MGHLVVWVVAYLFTGLSLVTLNAGEPAWNRPRALQTAGGTVAMLLTWPFVALAHSTARCFSHVVLFAIVGAGGEVIRQFL